MRAYAKSVTAKGVVLVFLVAIVALLTAQQVVNGYRVFANIAAPATPSSGYVSVYADSTMKLLCMENDAGMLDCIAVAPVTTTTVTSCNLGAASGCASVPYNSGYTYNQYGSGANSSEVTYTLPATPVFSTGLAKQYCVANDNNNGSTGVDSGILRVNANTGQHIRYKGTVGASAGYVASAGAAGDAACFVGVNTTDWVVYVQVGTWTQDSGG